MSALDKVEKLSKQVYLVGLGIYSSGMDAITKQYDKAYEESNRLFGQLVERGESLEKEWEKGQRKKPKVVSRSIDNFRDKLGLPTAHRASQLDHLNDKLDKLISQVEEVAKQKEKPAKRATTSKSTTEKKTTTAKKTTTTRSTRKPAARASSREEGNGVVKRTRTIKPKVEKAESVAPPAIEKSISNSEPETPVSSSSKS